MESKSGIVNVAFLELKVVLEISHIPIHGDNLIVSPTLLKQYYLSSAPWPFDPWRLLHL